jgi:S-methylmethionine-dependent homocysteine/selenocysteine methylase
MTRYRSALPQLAGDLFLTDGGIETTLIYHHGCELPDFAAFHLLKSPAGTADLDAYFVSYAEIARRFGTGLILESATWRASVDWGARLGYSRQALADANIEAVRLLEGIRRGFESERVPIVVSGCVGPRGDGYVADKSMSADQAETYHREQIETFAGTAADMVCAITMNYAAEAVGIARAARQVRMPVAISFTVETDGRLPTGQSLIAAIAEVDEATDGYPVYYMINCAHPSHFEAVLTGSEPWLARIRGIRANASRMCHADLNESTTLDEGNPHELATDYAQLKMRLPQLNVLGGCCGTDHRHVERIAAACVPLFRETLRSN